ncbi:hypothetical protein GGX14DRAFT_383710 [Mycena pura]|uniref:Uncharacterized protein n=1 Tax=Mycena pura TaxID=153505 RepID=A0AAD6UL73_9AGAR|nr:hypothetical protein GGX14DRAFT_383710 [Mycena pura]
MQDEDGPKIADKFYEYLFKNCNFGSNPPVLPDLNKSAEALHYAVLQLRREPDISFKRWFHLCIMVCSFLNGLYN